MSDKGGDCPARRGGEPAHAGANQEQPNGLQVAGAANTAPRVEDSHAALAAEMRAHVPSGRHRVGLSDWHMLHYAARVEALGRDQKTVEAWKALYDSMYVDKCALQREVERLGSVEEKKTAWEKAAR